ncbi:PREDICTED: methyltransferase-like protein 13 isoform X1 [Lupinus angustifolius]|uniref:methyltransferase-like protein 13 isoform X1 n=1 Tax=Lupinus angustifolius TaxID=3871 RepID=UPI00092FC563|nr:PREDICTED: methyltransferase-like protein 13 isoform X1 [Lupinus angustifolius]XP_019464943.1 PREDICTED: methyltransferase-like protein 13 isoform X1 [Lupinus angustifolius]
MALDVTFESICPSRFISFTIPSPTCSDSLLRVAVLDSPVQPTDSPQVGAMLVPEGRENDWIFSTELGQLQLLFSSPEISRLILIGNQFKEGDFSRNIYHRPLKCSLQEQGFEVWSKPLLLALSPRSLFRNGIPEIPILSYEDSLVSSIVIHSCVGYHVGEILVEDVEIESESEVHHGCHKREFRRRMRFKKMPNLIQTEIRIVPETDPSLNSVRIGDMGFIPDLQVLVHPYLAPMVASLSLISEYLEGQMQNGFKPKALCLGVGGGALLTFLTTQLGFEVMGVDNEMEVLRVAKDYFGLEDSECMHIVVGDAIKYIKKLAYHENPQTLSSIVDCDYNCLSHLVDGKVNHKFDVVMVDLDSSDIRSGISSPPLEFVRKNVLLAVKLALSESGILAINVIPSTKSFYDNLVTHFLGVFEELYKIDVGNGENFVLIATVSPQVFSVGDHSNAFLVRLRSVIPEAYINSIIKI